MAHLEPSAVAIGAAVRGAIAQAGLSQAEASERTGIALNTLSRRVNGLLPFTWPEIVRIANVTGTTASELASIAERLATQRSAGSAA